MENGKIQAIEKKHKRFKTLFYVTLAFVVLLLVGIFANEFALIHNNKITIDVNFNRSRIDKLDSDLKLANARVLNIEKEKFPVDSQVQMSGVWYEVQIGAFKNFNLKNYDQGITNISHENEADFDKYRLGAFLTYEMASDFKKDIRKMGIKDAFIVAKKDGVKIEVSQARKE